MNKKIEITNIYHPIERPDHLNIEVIQPTKEMILHGYACFVLVRISGQDLMGYSAELICQGRLLSKHYLSYTKMPPDPVFEIRAGFSLVGRPSEFTITLRLCDPKGHQGPDILKISGTQPISYALEYSSTSSLSFCPLISLGRSGSTILMQSLADHPALVTNSTYPYETKFAQQSVFSAIERCQMADHDHMHFQASIPYKGSQRNAYYRPDDRTFFYFSGPYTQNILSSTYDQIQQFYQFLSYAGEKTPRYFIEKFSPSSSNLDAMIQLLGGIKPIILVRDFRDVVASVLAFNQKRGFDGFGRENVQSDEDYLKIMGHSAQDLVNFHHAHNNVICVFYEDLILHTRDVFIQVLEYLDLENTDIIVESMVDKFSHTHVELSNHMTSQSATESLARWKTDMPHHMQDQMLEHLAPMLRYFNYSL